MTTDPAGSTAILLIAHGSRREEANEDARALAERIAARGEYPIVRAAFLELAEPDIPTGAEACVAAGATRVLMIPYFLAEGVHLHRDLVAARDELAGRFPHVDFRLGSALGPHSLLDRLVIERIREADRRPSGPASGQVQPGDG